MSDAIDVSKFSVDEKPREYEVMFAISGTIRMTVEADSLEDAQKKAFAITEGDGFGTEIDDVEECTVGRVYKARPMYRVTRDGGKMQTSHLEPGDTPREPDDRGF